MTREISNSDDVLDSRDIIERIEELESLLPETAELVMPGTANELEEIRTELEALQALAEQAASYAPDWEYGATLVRDSYFVDYCEEMVKDIGDLPANIPGYLAIDWEATADNLRVDYTSVEFDGVTYWVR